MFYPDEFKAKVMEVCSFGDESVQEEVQQYLEDGDSFLGTHLSHAYATSFSFQEILDANSLEELQVKAKRMQEIYLLWLEWTKLYNEQKQ